MARGWKRQRLERPVLVDAASIGSISFTRASYSTRKNIAAV